MVDHGNDITGHASPHSACDGDHLWMETQNVTNPKTPQAMELVVDERIHRKQVAGVTGGGDGRHSIVVLAIAVGNKSANAILLESATPTGAIWYKL